MPSHGSFRNSLPEFLDFKLFGKIILVVNRKFELFWPINSNSEGRVEVGVPGAPKSPWRLLTRSILGQTTPPEVFWVVETQHAVDGQNPFRINLKPWDAIVCWYLQGNRIIPWFLRWCEMDFVHPQYLLFPPPSSPPTPQPDAPPPVFVFRSPCLPQASGLMQLSWVLKKLPGPRPKSDVHRKGKKSEKKHPQHGCRWETFCIFAHCGLVVEIQPLNC